VVCKGTDSPTMDCPDVCLEASVGRLPQEVLLEEFYRSECSDTVGGWTCTCVRRVADCV
jgi:hypothetical protein